MADEVADTPRVLRCEDVVVRVSESDSGMAVEG